MCVPRACPNCHIQHSRPSLHRITAILLPGLEHVTTPDRRPRPCHAIHTLPFLHSPLPRPCANPQLWRLGWGTPVATLYGNDLPVGQVLSYTLPAVYSTPSSFLRIVVDWMDGPRSLLTSSSQLDR